MCCIIVNDIVNREANYMMTTQWIFPFRDKYVGVERFSAQLTSGFYLMITNEDWQPKQTKQWNINRKNRTLTDFWWYSVGVRVVLFIWRISDSDEFFRGVFQHWSKVRWFCWMRDQWACVLLFEVKYGWKDMWLRLRSCENVKDYEKESMYVIRWWNAKILQWCGSVWSTWNKHQ